MTKIRVIHSKKLQNIIDNLSFENISVICQKLSHLYKIDHTATYETAEELNSNDIKTYIKMAKEPGNYYIANKTIEIKFKRKKKFIVRRESIWFEFKAIDENEVLKLFRNFEKKLLLI